MKRILLMLVLAFLPYALTAGITEKSSEMQQIPDRITANPAEDQFLEDYSRIDKSDLMQANYEVLQTVRNASFNMWGRLTPIVYEPKSGNIIIATTNYTNIEGAQDGDPFFTGTITLFASDDGGGSWSEPYNLFESIETVPANGSIGVANPTGSNDFKDFNYLAMVRHYEWAPDDPRGASYWWDGTMYYIVPDATDPEGSSESFVEVGPDRTDQSWGSIMLRTHDSDNAESYIYGVGRLSPTADGYQYGVEGFFSFYFDEGDFNFEFRGTPETWELQNFYPSTDVNSTYNSYIYHDVDQNGNVYAIANNVPASGNPEAGDRTIMVSKSMDNGATFSAWEEMPKSIIDSYYESFVGNSDYSAGIFPYNPNGFVVTGEDEFSYVTKAGINIDGDNTYDYFHILEIYKKDGSWGVRKVADWEPYNNFIIRNVGTETFKDSLATNFMDQEFQLSKTADGQHIVFKWVQIVDNAIPIVPPVTIAEGTPDVMILDTLNTTDVFMTYRTLGEDAWAEEVNVTRDDLYNKITHIPHVVPNINAVPMVSLNTMPFPANSESAYRHYPPFLAQLIVDYPQDVVFTSVDIQGVNVAEEETPTNLMLHDAYPNPANDVVELAFSLEQGANVTLEVHDAMGKQVALLMNGYKGQGTHLKTFDVNNLSSGVYYYTLTVNGQKLTKILTVTH